MLNREKIRLMTDLAVYEKKNDEKVFKINDHYKGDYISSHLISSFIRYTLCFLLLAFAYLFLDLGAFFEMLNENGFESVAERLVFLYAAGLLIYLFITYRIYAGRYKKAKRGALLYTAKLKRLGRKYASKGRVRQ